MDESNGIEKRTHSQASSAATSVPSSPYPPSSPRIKKIPRRLEIIKAEPSRSSSSSYPDEAVKILIDSPQILRLFLGLKAGLQERYDASATENDKKYLLSDQLHEIGHIKTKAQMVFMIKAFVDHLSENGENITTLETKEGGLNIGFVATTEKGKYYVKSFLNSDISGREQINEIFAYKLLEILGYGPKCDCCFYKDILSIIVTRDLTEHKEKPDGAVDKSFSTSDLLLKQPLEKSEKTDSFIFTTEILTRLLQLGDVSTNLGNTGFVKTTGVKGEKIKPKIIDFHFDLGHRSYCIAINDSIENLSFEAIVEPIMAELKGDKRTAAMPFASKVATETMERSYLEALGFLVNGYKKRPNLEEAIVQSFDECRRIAASGSRPSQLNMDDLASYKTTLLSKADKLHTLYEVEQKKLGEKARF